jgi:peptidyl-prolyl cis-trans isomerase SurA
MRKFIIFFILFFIFFSQITLAQVNNKIIIKVENQIITNFEVKNKILSILLINNEEINQENINKYKNIVMNLLVSNKLKKIEVDKYNIKKNDTKINAYVSSIIPDVSALKQKFLNNGLDYQMYIDEISTELKWQELIYKIYSKKIDINESNINNEVDEFIKNKSDIEEFKISQIEVLINENEKIEEKILSVKKQISEDGFEKTALKYNDSYSASKEGNLGWINSKSLSKEINNLLSVMKIGNVSSPIIKQDSIIFLKINDKRISKKENIDINKLKENFINNKKNEQFNLYSKSHMSKLKNTSRIEYK